jgi:hypothetical protein
MRALSDTDCLDVWDRGLHRHPLDQALLVLSVVLPGTSYDSLADWSLGRLNRALVEVHCRCFGSALSGWVACERCQEKLEFEIDARTVIGQEPAQDEPVRVNGWTFRLPTARDLARAATAGEPAAAVCSLLESCQVAPVDRGSWTDSDIEAIGEKMAAADPLAETRLILNCHNCGHEWTANFDIATFVWRQIGARGRRAVADVHALAHAYGWTEAQILSLTENRRAHYLEMVRA